MSFPKHRPVPSAVARFEARRTTRIRYVENSGPAPAPEGGPPRTTVRPHEAYPVRREAARHLAPIPVGLSSLPQAPRSTEMLNVLVVDTEKSSSFLVKSILLGKRFCVSIATTIAEATCKADTGLFDIIIFDLPPSRPEEARFIVDVHREQPAVPILLLYRGERPQDLPVFEALAKPIRVAEVSECALRAAKRVVELAAAHRALALPAEVRNGERTLRCKVTTMSTHGMLVEAEEKDFARLTQFHTFFVQEVPDTLTATVVIAEGNVLKLTGKIAFAERTPDQKVRQVALSIHGETDEEMARLAAFLKGVA